MRYADVEIEELKRLHPIEDIFREHGYDLIKRGKHLATLCRYHPDKNPSLIITPENGLWNCLGCSSHNGGCRTGGDVFEFLMKEKKIDFVGAVEYLKQRNGHIPLAAVAAKEKNSTLPSTINPQKLLNRVIDYYHKIFYEDKRGYNYLANERSIKDKSLYETFKMGFCNGTLFKTIPQEGDVVEALKSIGILTRNNHELFKDCVIFPIMDKNGNVVHIYGRKTVEEPVKHLYLPGNHRGVFNQNILRSHDEIILAESIIDSVSLYQAGFKNTIPCYGINGLTEDHIKAFKENNTRKIIILFDGDDAGRKASEEIKKKMDQCSFSCRIAALSDNEDPNSYLKKNPPADLEKILYPPGLRNTQSTVRAVPATQRNPFEDGFTVEHCSRRYLVRGIEGGQNKLKANIKAEYFRRFHIDTVDSYSAKSRSSFIKDAAILFKEEQQTVEEDMQNIITATEEFTAAKRNNQDKPVFIMSEEEKREAVSFGKQQNLIEAIVRDITQCGYIGEDMNKLISYLAMSSRKMENPLSVLIISGSGSGKTSLQDTVLSLSPEEDLIKLTSLTGKALFYKKELSLSEKILAVEEEKGAEDADYAIRNLITSKELVIEATIKDVATGKLTTMTNTVKCNTAVFKTTTNPETNPETKTRFIVLSIDESRRQTQRILEYQREMETEAGYIKKDQKESIIRKHQNFQRILRPITVINPYAKLLTYLDDRISVRRDHPKYLQIIKAIAFLHQFQRPIKTLPSGREYIEATIEDIALANEIAHEVLGRSISELTRPSKELLEIIYKMVLETEKTNGRTRGDIQFTRRQVREYNKWSDYQIKIHIKQLEELEYLIPVMGSRGKQYSYKLAYNGEGQDGGKFILGLINTEKLREMLQNGETCRVVVG